MTDFDDLGLRPELLNALSDEEIEQPTALQATVIPAARRGGNLVARASTGSGKTLAYALPILDRLGEAEPAPAEEQAPLGPRCVVVVPLPEEAERVALAIGPYAQAVGFRATAIADTWGTGISEAEVVVGTVADLMQSVRASEVKLDRVEALVIDGAAQILEVGDPEQLETLLELFPRDAQRLLFSAEISDAVEDLADRRVKRALRYPAEPALGTEPPPAGAGEIAYVLVQQREKLDILARQLTAREGESPPPIVFARTDERAADLAEHLSIRGFAVGAAGDMDADVAIAVAGTSREELVEETGGELGQTISYDVPVDADTLLARHAGDPDAVVMVEPRELPHMKEIARLAQLRARSVALPAGRTALAELRSFRERIRRALAEEDLGSQLLVLEPLLDEYSAPEVAAALAALLRRKPPPAAPAAPPAQQGAPARKVTAATAPAPEAGPAPAAWARLFVSIGSRDDVRPGDLVGALAGEANIKGSKIGKIEIRDSFSIVEVQSDVADQVIRAVNGTTVKGRSVRVDYDRAGSRPARRGGGGGGGPERRGGGPGGRRMVRRPEKG